MNKIYFYPITLLVFIICSNNIQAQDFKTIGYLPYYRFALVDDIAFEKLTHLNIAFANPDHQGNLSVGGQDIDPIVSIGHNHDLDVYISLAGGLTVDWVNNWMDLLQPENRTAFIHKIVHFTLTHDLQGVDVDLEWSNVTENYSGFVLELKDSLSAYQLGMTAALPGSYRYPDISNDALNAFDWINMMIYDHTGPWAPNSPGQHSSYQHAVSAVNYWTNSQGVDPSRLTLGVPFYGYDFTNSNDVHAFTYGSMVGIDVGYADQDQVGLAYYNGRATIANKTELALNAVSGIMIWELGQDALGVDSDYSLLDVIYQTIANHFVDTSTAFDAFKPLVYPNPFSDYIHVEQLGQAYIRLQLTSIDGKIIFTKNLDIQQLSTTLSTTQLKSGIYILTIANEDRVVTHKLIKNQY